MSTLLLDKLLDPASIAVIGASARPDSPGHQLTRNLLLSGYEGRLFLVNPRYRTVLDTECYKSVRVLPETPDLALILTPARLLRKTLVQCARKGIKVAIVMSGSEYSRELHGYARRLGMRLMGPYCAGLIRPHIHLNATFSDNRISAGNLAVVSQSASLAAAMVDWAEGNNVGFSALLSTGQNAEISLADLLDLLTTDRHTRAVIVYIDHVGTSRSFLSALGAAARSKPVVLMRATQAGISHCDALTRSGELISSDDVFQAALNRAGVVRIRTFENLFSAARILSSGIRIKGNRIAIISNGNAPSLIAQERLKTKGLNTPVIDTDILQPSDRKQLVNLTGDNPIVLRGDNALASYFHSAISGLQKLDCIDALLVIFIPDSRNDPGAIAKAVVDCYDSGKPLIACWMGDTRVLQAREALSKAGIPTFNTPEAATDAVDFLHRHLVSQQQLLQHPNPASHRLRADTEAAKPILSAALHSGTRVLDPVNSRTLMELFDIPVLPSQVARELTEATFMAQAIGYPVALKLVSPNISYKASVVPTRLHINDERQLSDAWQVITLALTQHRPDAEFGGIMIEAMHVPDNQRQLAVSISRDSVFGPVITLSLGGNLTAMLHQRVVQLPPLNNFLIDDMLESRQIQNYLGTFRHTKAVDDLPVRHVLKQLSALTCQLPEVFSVDINPLVLSNDGAIAMDIQVVVERSDSTNRYQHLAIHPYPWEWIRNVMSKKGIALQLRPIRPSDAMALNTLVRGMTAESRYFRFMHAINELTPLMVAQFTKLDYDRQMAFVATKATDQQVNNSDNPPALLGVSRYTISHDRKSAEFAVSVGEDSKGQGVATALMKLLIEHATSQGLEKMHGDVLRSNTAMHGLMKSLGFTSSTSQEDPDVLVFTYLINLDYS